MGMFGSRGGLRFVVPIKEDESICTDKVVEVNQDQQPLDLSQPKPFTDLRRSKKKLEK